ncbi:MAG: hypothetical protein QG673_1112 [Pseudomonadota bacterium]|nr:hypothetical protein [Pseudomonadota bacterium]
MIVHNTRSYATLKSVYSGRFIDINENHLILYGFKNASGVICLTVWDMNEKMDYIFYCILYIVLILLFEVLPN